MPDYHYGPNGKHKVCQHVANPNFMSGPENDYATTFNFMWGF